jgi:hypothetical protein
MLRNSFSDSNKLVLMLYQHNAICEMYCHLHLVSSYLYFCVISSVFPILLQITELAVIKNKGVILNQSEETSSNVNQVVYYNPADSNRLILYLI